MFSNRSPRAADTLQSVTKGIFLKYFIEICQAYFMKKIFEVCTIAICRQKAPPTGAMFSSTNYRELIEFVKESLKENLCKYTLKSIRHVLRRRYIAVNVLSDCGILLRTRSHPNSASIRIHPKNIHIRSHSKNIPIRSHPYSSL